MKRPTGGRLAVRARNVRLLLFESHHFMPAARNVIVDPPVLPLVAPSILSADFAHLAADCAAAIEAGADLLHLDVMDGHFVPNLTFGPALCRSLRAALPDVTLDVHLMVTDPALFVDAFADAGADHLTFHLEVVDDPIALAERVRARGMTAGIAINPPTPVEAVLPLVEAFEMTLIMSVNPGFSGQGFLAEVLEKVETVRDRLRPEQRLEMDGGVNGDSVERCRRAGCDLIVAGNGIFAASDYRQAIELLRGTSAPAGKLGR